MGTEQRRYPADPVAFIRERVHDRRVFWTYHASMRLVRRSITRMDIFDAVAGCVLIESYPDDKYLPSYLVLGFTSGGPIHVLIAVDVDGDNVRIVTAYRPDPQEWENGFSTRRKS